ncbi:helix-turn-helix domain-containing protein [Symbioplanes lichenis]|uniref:helix-turn-helix domain-containing protein n=1 Tax=Symbioplanes lichenis TaxID=1629072 RepID=UPI002739B302|nr:helix-turn-helix transcriptional regulator [Actinoplanes lichenis]
MAEAPVDEIDLFYIEVGKRIRDARNAARITQAELADAVGLTRTSITNLEAGRQRMPLHLFAAIARRLGVGPQHLMAESEGLGEFDRALNRHLSMAPDTTREFVHGAIAQLGVPNREEE